LPAYPPDPGGGFAIGAASGVCEQARALGFAAGVNPHDWGVAGVIAAGSV